MVQRETFEGVGLFLFTIFLTGLYIVFVFPYFIEFSKILTDNLIIGFGLMIIFLGAPVTTLYFLYAAAWRMIFDSGY